MKSSIRVSLILSFTVFIMLRLLANAARLILKMMTWSYKNVIYTCIILIIVKKIVDQNSMIKSFSKQIFPELLHKL